MINPKIAYEEFKKSRTFENLENTDPLKKNLDNSNSYVCCVFELSLAIINNNSLGIQNEELLNIESLSQFNKIFTGTNNLLAKWENAYTIERLADNNLKKNIKVGRHFNIFLDSDILGSSFESSGFDSDFLLWNIEQEFTAIVYEDIKQEDCLKLFLIPEIGKDSFFYIRQGAITRYYSIDKKLIRCEVTFTKLNNQLSKSGQALEQFLQRGAPGEGYAWPLINLNGEVQLSPIHLINYPISEIQAEYNGVCALSTFYAWGRPVSTKMIDGVVFNLGTDIITPPVLLLPLEMRTPEPSPLTTRGATETDFYILQDAIPSFEANYENWKEYVKAANYDTTKIKNYEGFLTSAKLTYDQVTQTNQLINNQIQFTLTNPNFKVNFSNFSYWNNASTFLKYNNLTFTNQLLNIPQMLAHNIFVTEHLTVLPMNLTQNINWNLTDIPLIGGFLNKLTFGVPVGWKNQSFRIVNKPILLLCPASIVNYASKSVPLLGNQTNKIRIPLELFGENSNTLIKDVGINSMATNFKIALTDTFLKNGVIHNTQELLTGAVKWEEDCEPTPNPNVEGYIIDSIITKSISKSKMRITAWSGGYSVWQGSFFSKSLFTGNIRDWVNIIKMSDWNITILDNINWPRLVNSILPNELTEIRQQLGAIDNKQITFNFNWPELDSQKVILSNDVNLVNFQIAKNTPTTPTERTKVITTTTPTKNQDIESKNHDLPFEVFNIQTLQANYKKIILEIELTQLNQDNQILIIEIETKNITTTNFFNFVNFEFGGRAIIPNQFYEATNMEYLTNVLRPNPNNTPPTYTLKKHFYKNYSLDWSNQLYFSVKLETNKLLFKITADLNVLNLTETQKPLKTAITFNQLNEELKNQGFLAFKHFARINKVIFSKV